MRDRELFSLLHRASELLDRVLTVAPERLAEMRERSRWPLASSHCETTHGGGESHWCWEHEREVPACRRAGLECSGEMVEHPTDPTGAAAAARADGADRAASDYRQLVADARSLVSRVESLAACMERYGADGQRRDDQGLGPGAGACRACQRWVSGTSSDRLKSGYCRACHEALRRYRARTSQPDRAEFERLRRERRDEAEAS